MFHLLIALNIMYSTMNAYVSFNSHDCRNTDVALSHNKVISMILFAKLLYNINSLTVAKSR